MIMSVSTLRIGRGAATAVRLENFCILFLSVTMSQAWASSPEAVGKSAKISFGCGEPDNASTRFSGRKAAAPTFWGQLIQTPFNAS
jgi:hypothetical protein